MRASQLLALSPYPASGTETTLYWSVGSSNMPKVLGGVSFNRGYLLMVDFQNTDRI